MNASLIKAQAFGLGFDLVGITKLGVPSTAVHFQSWVTRGYAGDMHYMQRGADKRMDARLPFPSARSAVVVGLDYGGKAPSGPVARYARGDDYHDIMWQKLDALHEWIDEQVGGPIAGRSYVDTGPILERDLARNAGLGWFGKNTLLVNPRIGSFFFIGALFVDLDLETDKPFEEDRCGTCSRCIDACPTNALVEERVLDATRCISYLTIESRSEIPPEFHTSMRDLLYGCDICQDVCPWNVRFARDLPHDSPFSSRDVIRDKGAKQLAQELLDMSQENFAAAFRRSPMKRAKLSGLKRNAAVVIG
jgi:epoxyqueuosine reductase